MQGHAVQNPQVGYRYIALRVLMDPGLQQVGVLETVQVGQKLPTNEIRTTLIGEQTLLHMFGYSAPFILQQRVQNNNLKQH